MKFKGLDWLRCIAAFGIVGCHLGLFPRTIGGEWVTTLCDFNVGLFAAISGLLMPNMGKDEMWEYVKKRTKRLLPTYFVWSIVYLIATVMFDIVLDGGKLNERYYSISNWGKVIFWGCASAHLWFLICLFYSQIILKWFVQMLEMMKIKEHIQFVLLEAISIILLYCSINNNSWYCIYPVRLITFLILGYVIKVYDKNWVIIPLLGVIVMITIHLGMHRQLPGFLRDYLLVIPVMMLFVSNVFKESKLATSLSKTSMGVYLVHPLWARGVSLAVTKIFQPPYGAIIVITEWCIIGGLSLLSVILLKKIPITDRFLR